MSAASLSTALDAAWERQQKDATRFNDRLSHGQVQPGLWRVLPWLRTQSILYSRSSASLKEPSPDLARALNDVLGTSFWIGGLCKVSQFPAYLLKKALDRNVAQIFADICQMMGPIVIKVLNGQTPFS